jgi:signal transduction histidine kinase
VNEEPKQDYIGIGTIQKLTRLLAAPVIEPSQRAARIQTVEKDIVLPLRMLIITIVGYYLFFANWFVIPATNGTVNFKTSSRKPNADLSSTFSPEEIRELPDIISFWREPSDAVSAFMWQSLSNEDRITLKTFHRFGSSNNQAQAVVMRALNKMIDGPSLYETNRFKGITLRPETTNLLQQSLASTNAAILNRLLLEDAYDKELAKNPNLLHPPAPKRPDPDTDPANSNWSLRHASALKSGFIAYALLNLIVSAIFLRARQLTLTEIEWMVFAAGVMDCVLMGTLTFLYDGFDSKLFTVFAVLILHNALAIPVAFPQLLLNFLCIGSFVTAGIQDRWINIRQTIMDVDNISQEKPYERIIVLVAWALCCYGIQVLFEKQKRAEAEATELAVRQERLHTAGRLAAEIAHQIKNPLGIITNAAFCLNRAVQEGETAVDDQIQIIREEVDRADQIITELMGYAQLAEGTVERLDVAEELDAAVQEVFPPAAKYQIKIHKDYAPALPALLMQKRHLSSVLVNILQNAREAMHGRGEVRLSAQYGKNDSVCITLADSGPGIPPDKIGKIFEAYFTTREKGTGLGLAIVKHNTEMYGGAVQVESELGKGTRFMLEFPGRILMRSSK